MTQGDFCEAVAREVARLLRQAREAKGLSMTQLAAQAGLSHAMISFVERNLRNPTFDTLLRISLVLGTDLPDLIARALRAAGPRPEVPGAKRRSH